MKDLGRPEYTDNQYRLWLDEMKPFLKGGYSLYYAIEKAGLMVHKDSIYRKSRLKDWFCEKIEAFQSYPGEIANNAFISLISKINEKFINDRKVDKAELSLFKFFCKRHRSCKPFFVLANEERQIKANKVEVSNDKLDKKKHEEIDIFFRKTLNSL